jgi:hypothetical protein
MMQVGMLDQSDERRQEFESEALRIVNAAAERGIVLRLLGSLAFKIHCSEFGHLQKQLGRAFTDIDYAAYETQASQMPALFKSLGYRDDPEINLYFAGQRSIYNNNGSGIHLDIFYNKLSFCHDIVWTDRLEYDFPTIPLAEMVLEKMQIVKINEKDIIDTIMLFLEHPLGDNDHETINISRISKLCSADWGLWRTITMNLQKVSQLGQTYADLSRTERDKVSTQVETALEKINAEPKSFSWKVRSKIGDKVKWYQEVDDIA